MPRVRAVVSFVRHPKDVDVGDILDVSDAEALKLVHGLGHCVPVDPVADPPTVMTTNSDPTIQHADPPVKRRR